MSRTFRGEALAHAMRMARVELPADRVEIVRMAAESVYAVIDGLDTVELGETPPATAFVARWD
jgi:hypothetical protein